MAMASCSQDETIGINHDGDEITFNVVTNNATRAENVYCNQNLPGGFYVSAISDGKTYIDGDHVTGSNGNWTNTSGTRYWPETPVDFYAHVNGEASYTWSVNEGKATAKFENFQVSKDVAKQVDLLYAVKTGQEKADGKVNLNFRHALSQIVFQAKNTNANLYVEIAGVSVANVGGTNTFTFPSANTETNIVDHDENADDVYEDGEFGSGISYDESWGTWAALTQGTEQSEQYNVDFPKTAVPGNNTLVALTTANETGKEYNSNAMLLLPQETTAWDPGTNPLPGAEKNTGSYLLVDCAIFNVAGDDYADGDVCLWGEQKEGVWNTKELAIPVAFDWEQGKKYVYTLVFGKGNGGYDPDPEPDPDPDKPDPVLVPITFEITVDDFELVDGGEIESGIPGQGA